MVHWFDELLAKVRESVGSRRDLVINGGLSVSGLQHVGRLRGEIVLSHALARALRGEGRSVVQGLVRYTQDQWKGTEWQRSLFPPKEAEAYVGRRLIDIPDPQGCHDDWVEHFWEEFGAHLDAYAPDVQVTSTTDVYRREDMRALVADLAGRAEAVREVVNRYRARKPYPPGWIPFEPYCNACRRVDRARALRIHGTESADYACECGDEGTSSLELGKLNWRLEWPALWKILHVDVEPFGKDHAAPGGSRDSCKEIAQAVMGFTPPFGIPYEWVGYGERGTDRGDMGSSDAIGFGPAAWSAIGDPEVLRYTYLSVPPARRVVLDLSRADAYHDAFDLGEEAHYASSRSEESGLQARTFDLAAMGSLPAARPFHLPYRHAAYLAQIAPASNRQDWVLKRLRETGVLDREPSEDEGDRIARRLSQAAAWVDRHAPENRVTLLERLTDDVRSALTAADRQALGLWAERASTIEWREEAIKESMIALTKGGALPVETPAFFRALYLALMGKERGPRAAPFLAVLDRGWVLDRLREASETG